MEKLSDKKLNKRFVIWSILILIIFGVPAGIGVFLIKRFEINAGIVLPISFLASWIIFGYLYTYELRRSKNN